MVQGGMREPLVDSLRKPIASCSIAFHVSCFRMPPWLEVLIVVQDGAAGPPVYAGASCGRVPGAAGMHTHFLACRAVRTCCLATELRVGTSLAAASAPVPAACASSY